MSAHQATRQAVGRNDPCPCGSGKKYKKCCMERHEQLSALHAAAPPADLQKEIAVVTRVNAGGALHQQGQWQAAIAQFNQALDIDPNYALAYFNRAMSFFALGQYAQMQQDFDRAFALEPNNAQMLTKASYNFRSLKLNNRSIDMLERAVAIKPDGEEAWVALAEAYYRVGDVKKSRRLYTTLAAQFPHNRTVKLELACMLPNIQPSQRESDAARAGVMTALDRLMAKGFTLKDPTQEVLNLPFYHGYHGRNVKDFMAKLAEFFLHCCPSLNYTAPHCHTPPACNTRLRIGLVSEAIHTPTLNQFYASLFRALMQDAQVEIVLLSPSAHMANEDAQKMRQAVHQAIRLPAELEQAREVIANARIDILVYLELGMSNLSYFLAFSRLAPVQCVMSGHPVTSGIPNIDYYLSSRYLEPENASDHYTEKLKLADFIISVFSRRPAPAQWKSRRELGLPEGEVRLYTCPVTLFKLHPDMDKAFAAILARDPQARIVLFDSETPTLWRQSLEQRFAASMPTELAQRILFMPFAKDELFAQMLHAMDVILDNFHFSFGTTVYLVLGLDLPFVTLPGEFMRGRVSCGFYEFMGLRDLIAASPEHYVELAIKLATDPDFKRGMAEKIRALSPEIFDDLSVAPKFAAFLKNIYAEHTR